MANANIWRRRVEDFVRHLIDLEHDNYEGARSRTDREKVFRTGFELVTPVALRVLEDMNAWLLASAGTVKTIPIGDDGADGLEGRWTLEWPALATAHRKHGTGPLEPVRLVAVFPAGWTHGHFERPHPGLPADVTAWPFQITNQEDAERQEPVLRIFAEAELHERVYQAGDWNLCQPTPEFLDDARRQRRHL